MKFRVRTADNFHYMDESEVDDSGSYSTAQEAIAAAQQIVDKSLRWLYQPGFTAAKLYDHYQDFGDDPYIVTDDGGRWPFSAWSYAESRCAAICDEMVASGRSEQATRGGSA